VATVIEGRKVTYHGRHKLGGWKYSATELGSATVPGDLHLDAAELEARRLFPSATWFSCFELFWDGSRRWVGSGSL
jgi:hypothetical protein